MTSFTWAALHASTTPVRPAILLRNNERLGCIDSKSLNILLKKTLFLSQFNYLSYDLGSNTIAVMRNVSDILITFSLDVVDTFLKTSHELIVAAFQFFRSP